MPQRNSRKVYLEHGFYHVYNRGVEKRNIFTSAQDYKVFLGYVREYLSPPTIDNQNHTPIKEYRQRKQYSDIVQLQCYALMPNHFHFLIRQKNSDSMKEFLQSLCTRYSMYFNKQNDRVGSLFQGRYKAVIVKTDEQLVHLSRYIHLNPVDLGFEARSLDSYPYSSYRNYLGKINDTWLNPKIILGLFIDNRSGQEAGGKYRKFVEQYFNKRVQQTETELLQYLTIERAD